MCTLPRCTVKCTPYLPPIRDWCGWKLDRISPSSFRWAVSNIYKKLVTDRLPGLPKNAEPVGADAILTQVTDFSWPMCSLWNPTQGHRLLNIRMGQWFPAAWVKIASAPTVQTQERGRKPHSMIWRSSRMEIMTYVLNLKGGLSFCSVIIDNLLGVDWDHDKLHHL